MAAHRLGKKLTVMYYEKEHSKMLGLAQTAESTTPEEIKKMNDIAFSALKQTLVELKKKKNSRVEKEEK